ncbi:MAG: BatA and WFA domain-containing protein [Phycisphaerales bacterium]
MTFLAPVAGIVAGALGLIGVLVSYFLKLRRRPVRIASTLLWEQAVQDLQVNAPFRMLRASWLLLLQLLVVACIALAIARPAIEGDGPTAERVVLIVDVSASMSARDGADGNTRFEEARRRAIQRVDRLPGDARIMVIASGASAETAIAFTRDHGAVRAALRALEPTDQSGDLSRAVRVVRAFARSVTEEGAEALPAIYVYTDGADAPPAGLGVPVPADRVRIERVGPAPSATAGVDNVGVGAVAARRDFEDPALVRLFARLVSARATDSEVPVRLLIDGAVVEAKTVPVPGRDADGSPGEAPVTFDLRDADGALAIVSIAGEDLLPADDEAGVVLAPPASSRVIVVQPEESVTVSQRILMDAIDIVPSAELIGRLTADEYERQAADPSFFAGVDLLVFDGVLPAEAPPVPTLTFRPVGDAGLVEQRVAYWSRSHPLMRDLRLGTLVVRAPADFALIRREGVRTEDIVEGESATLVGAIEEGGLRRVVVSFLLRNSNWRDESYPLFIANAVDWLTLAGAREAATSADTASPASVFDDTLVGGTRITLRGPGGISRVGTSEPSGRVVFGVLPRAGLYTADLPGGDRTIAVNLASPSESALVTRDLSVVAGQPMGERASDGQAGTIEVWRWFVLGALALLAIEFVVYAWKMRL